MSSLLIAMVLFVAGHFALSWLPVRRRLVGRLGEKGFSGAYSLLMVALLVWAGIAYANAPVRPLWDVGAWARWVVLIGTLPAITLIVAAVATPNPTAVGGQRLYGKADPAPGVLRLTRHPMMWGITLWAALHLLVNGDLASLILFGGLLVLSLLGPLHIDAKRRAQDPEGYAKLTARTSFWPWGRGWVSPFVLGWPKMVIGIIAWVVLLALHPVLFGAAPLGG